jgi:hypothetical protein
MSFGHLFAQEIFENGDKVGLKYNGVVHYSAIYDKIVITDYFVCGIKDEYSYNLSRNKSHSTKKYRRFKFDLLDQLLVVGVTTDGKKDLFDDTGQHLYLEDGDYDRVFSKSEKIKYGNNDLVLVSKKGKLGLYNWTQKKEIVSPIQSKIVVHESCMKDSYIIYVKRKGENTVIKPSGEKILSFRAKSVQDIYHSTICKGYILKRNTKIGFFYQRSNQKNFLIKPIYEDLFFPTSDPKIIIVQRYGRYGLYYNYKRVLKCKYDSIEIVNNRYAIARVVKNEKEMTLNSSGILVN